MDPGLHSVEQLPLARTAFVKRRSAGGVSRDDALHDGAVEVPMQIEQRDDHRLEEHDGNRQRRDDAAVAYVDHLMNDR